MDSISCQMKINPQKCVKAEYTNFFYVKSDQHFFIERVNFNKFNSENVLQSGPV